MKEVLFVISIDVEIDKSPDYSISSHESFESVIHGIPEILTPLFEQYSAKPTYLLSPEVIECKDCAKVLRNLKNCKLGTHLHGEFTEPYRKLYPGELARKKVFKRF